MIIFPLKRGKKVSERGKKRPLSQGPKTAEGMLLGESSDALMSGGMVEHV